VKTELPFLALLVACGGASAPPVAQPEEEEPPRPVVAVTLRFEEAPSDPATDTPYTRVLLVQIAPDEGRSTSEVGTFAGACQHVEPTVGTVLEARCWWAGAGAHVTVHREGDALVAERSVQDEYAPATPAEEVARMQLPENAAIHPLLPSTLAR
jgi:hypothetical protein